MKYPRAGHPDDLIKGLDREETMFVYDCCDFWMEAHERVNSREAREPFAFADILTAKREKTCEVLTNSPLLRHWDIGRVTGVTQSQDLCYTISLPLLSTPEQFALLQSALLDASYCFKNLAPGIQRADPPFDAWRPSEFCQDQFLGLLELLTQRIAVSCEQRKHSAHVRPQAFEDKSNRAALRPFLLDERCSQSATAWCAFKHPNHQVEVHSR
jgi:hypothetical protein